MLVSAPQRPAGRKAQRGLTLVELLTTITILSIVLGLGVPGLRQLLASQRMRTASYDLVSDLVLARSEALKRGTAVEVVPAAGGWGSGWTVRAFTGEPLAQRSGLAGVTVTRAPASVSFDLNGRVADSVRIGLTDGSRHRCISLDPTGRPRAATMECPS